VNKLQQYLENLEAEIAQRKQAEERIEHLNRVLRAIRSVNQLIVREKERDKLLKSACDTLIKTGDYDSAYICLFDESVMLVTHAEAGLDKDFLPMVERLKRGELTNCIERTLIQSGVLITKVSSLACGDCPLVKIYSGKKIATVRMEHGGKVYGLLKLQLSGDASVSREEESLLQEVTDDIAFALHGMELEEERKRLEHNLNERVKELQCLYDIVDIAERPDITLDELYQEVANLLPLSWQYPEITCSKITINGKEFRANNYRETEWKQSADIEVHRAKAGVVEVDYLEERPEIDEGPFLKEERLLINAVAERLGKITQRMQAEEELKNFHKELEIKIEERTAELAKVNTELTVINRELESFSYSVSHDLRAPLRTMDGFSQALLEEYSSKLDEQGKDYLQRVRSATHRMGILIGDMLSLSRITRIEMKHELVDLSGLVQSIATELQKSQPERRAEFIIASGVTANGDAHLLHIMLENLLGNAWKFTSKHSSARIEFGVNHHKDKPVYFVRDDGAGFDMTYADKLFGAFQRLHVADEFPGTGIGLATVQRIVHRHSGRIWAEGEVENGATFYFTLD
jgi:signal transduction histidine kinase